MDKTEICDTEGGEFYSHPRHFFYFFYFSFSKMAITFFGGNGGSTKFQILMYMSIRKYYINKTEKPSVPNAAQRMLYNLDIC